MSLIANTVPESIVGNDAVKIDETNFFGKRLLLAFNSNVG